ncbi:hypothetical protein DY000_02024171 [Brassica cretica]|uniref:Uncharacterized protein n=1 Tax=Brassica cretica TaxID=69181 RepID=A0ABQ7ECF2_BRACR|nr:hypothetical protein DY000_02024171 [Brassica cretica]
MKNHPKDEAPPSLSLGVSRCRSPLSGSELSSTSTKERWSELETKVRQTRRLQWRHVKLQPSLICQMVVV